MDLRLHFLEASGSLDRWRPQMEIEAKAVSSRIDMLVKPADRQHAVDVVVRGSEWGIIPETGLGGSCYEKTVVTIVLAPASENFERSMMAGEFGSTLAHELHHALRHATTGYGTTLGEALTSEGLADHFAVQATGCRQPLWTEEGSLSAHIAGEAERVLKSHDYDHEAWFFGRGDLPRWSGYALGWRIVEAYLARHPEESAATLVGMHADTILAEGWTAAKTAIPGAGSSHPRRAMSPKC